MHIGKFAAIAVAGLALTASAPAFADFYGEVEAARANARAGGPVSERDAELLDRWGCLSGTRSWYCNRGKRYDHRYAKPRRHYDE